RKGNLTLTDTVGKRSLGRRAIPGLVAMVHLTVSRARETSRRKATALTRRRVYRRSPAEKRFAKAPARQDSTRTESKKLMWQSRAVRPPRRQSAPLVKVSTHGAPAF